MYAFKLVGYDHATEQVSAQYPIPDRVVAEAMKIANPKNLPIGKLGDLPLTVGKAKQIGLLLKQRIPTEGTDFVFEISQKASQRAAG